MSAQGAGYAAAVPHWLTTEPLEDPPRDFFRAGLRSATQVARRLIEQFTRAAPVRPVPILQALTDREREVFTLVARGLSNAEIARTLYVSEHTIKTHVARVLMKLNVRDRVQAVVLAYQSGLVTAASS